MKTIRMEGYINAKTAEDWRTFGVIDGIYYSWVQFEDASNITPHALEFTVPDDAQEIIARAAIAELEVKRTALLAKTQAALTAIDDKIAKLSALTCEVSA